MKTMLFNPYTGKPRHPADIASDPSGILMLDPDEPIYEIPPEPKPKDFPKYFLYLQAKAGWDLLVQEMTGSKRSGEYKQF